MRNIKIAIVALLCVTLPGWNLHAAMPEMHGIMLDIPKLGGGGGDLAKPSLSWVEILGVEQSEPVDVQIQQEILDLVYPGLGERPSVSIESLTESELEEVLQDELMLDDQKFAWVRSKKLLGGLLVLTALLSGLVLLFAGGGSGGGSVAGTGGGGATLSLFTPPGGSGGGDGGGGETVGDENPNEDILDPEGPIGGGTGGNGDDDDPFSSDIPNNPEPSTMMLMGMGMLMPFLRRKKIA